MSQSNEAMSAAARQALINIAERQANYTFHRVECNADHNQPIGGDMCICVPPELRAAKTCLRMIEQTIMQRLAVNDPAIDWWEGMAMALTIVRDKRRELLGDGVETSLNLLPEYRLQHWWSGPAKTP